MSKIFIILFISLIISACSSSECEISKNSSNSLENKAVEKFENNYKIELNSNKEYALCTSQQKSKIPGPNTVKYFIYNLNEEKISYENSIPNGKISWKSEHELMIEEIPGIIQKDGPNIYKYILNVKNNSKTKLDGEIK